MNQSWIWAAIPIIAIVAGVLTTWIRARHGYPLDHRRGSRRRWSAGTGDAGQDDRDAHRIEPDAINDLKAAVASRDATIAKLEQRVRVLERIATDNPAALRDEIERLRT
jgi:hypothetical protein